MTGHFAQRVQEHIGNVDPYILWEGLRAAIDQGRTDYVKFCFREDRSGKRVFQFRLQDGRDFWALVNTNESTPITVFPKGYEIGRQGKEKVKLQ